MKNKAKYTDYIAEYVKYSRGEYLVRLHDRQIVSACSLAELRASVVTVATDDTYKQTLDFLNNQNDWIATITILPTIIVYVYEITSDSVIYRYNYEVRTKTATRHGTYFRTRDYGRVYLPLRGGTTL